MIKLGSHIIENPVMLAPMAGMSDLPFREICRAEGAGYAVGEMTASKPELRESRKSSTRWADERESGIRVVQILGADPAHMADAARYAADGGAHVVDINMGCPAKKVLNAACGSALMRDEPLVGRILDAVVNAVSVPVTLKIRTGWSREMKNALTIAKMAEAAGIAMLVIHGRTREDGFRGQAEYDTIREVKAAVSIPVVANGDIDGPGKALDVMRMTGADGVMIGRATYGNPWVMGAVAAALGTGPAWTEPDLVRRRATVLRHMALHFDYYGGQRGAVTIRKHLAHYLRAVPGSELFLPEILAERDPNRQTDLVRRAFDAAPDSSS